MTARIRGVARALYGRSRIVVVVVALAALYVVPAALSPLAEPDEARYAEVAREMAMTGDLITPRINQAPFLDKPPLTFWLGSACLLVFGERELAARLPVLLAASGGILLTFAIGRRLAGRYVALLAAFLLAISPLYLGMGQILTLDMPLTFWVTATMLCLWRRLQGGGVGCLRLAAVALAGGILTKGPIAAVLVATPIAVWVLVQRRHDGLRRLLDPLALVLLAALSLPWFALAGHENPGFVGAFVVRHHLQRFAAPWHHGEPFWFFLAVLPVATFPWGVLALGDRTHWKRLGRPADWSGETQFLVLWALWPALLFSLSRSKLIPYVTPSLPPLAILAARALTETWRRTPALLARRGADMLGAIGTLALTIGIGLPTLSSHPRAASVEPFLLSAGLALLVPSWLAGRLRPKHAITALGVGIVVFLGVAASGRTLAKNYRSLSLAAADFAAPTDRIGVYQRYVQGLPFYAKRPIFVVRDDPPWRPNTSDLARAWAGNERILLVIDDAALERIRPLLDPPPYVLTSERQKLLVSNRRGRSTRTSQSTHYPRG
jgi:4-amino-4-deoxy-L-arabinose transferase-like glycosyltransferase